MQNNEFQYVGAGQMEFRGVENQVIHGWAPKLNMPFVRSLVQQNGTTDALIEVTAATKAVKNRPRINRIVPGIRSQVTHLMIKKRGGFRTFVDDKRAVTLCALRLLDRRRKADKSLKDLDNISGMDEAFQSKVIFKVDKLAAENVFTNKRWSTIRKLMEQNLGMVIKVPFIRDVNTKAAITTVISIGSRQFMLEGHKILLRLEWFTPPAVASCLGVVVVVVVDVWVGCCCSC